MSRPIDATLVGFEISDHTAEVERGRLRFFAEATGQSDPVYTDLAAAKEAGHHDLPVPPTFLFCLNMENPDPFRLLHEIGVDPKTVLHAEQQFEHLAMTYAGDELRFVSAVSEVYEKKDGALKFVVRSTTVTRGAEAVARLDSTVVIRQNARGNE